MIPFRLPRGGAPLVGGKISTCKNDYHAADAEPETA